MTKDLPLIYPLPRSICCRRLAQVVICVLIAFTAWAAAQRRYSSRTPTGLDDIVFAISFSPDARTLAIARGAAEPSQRFGRVELWDTESGKLRHVIKGFDGPVKSISFSPDGQTLVSGSLEFRSAKIQEKARSRDGSVFGELKWWDGQTGELKHKITLPGEGSANLGVAFSPDGKDLAVTESFVTWSFLSPVPSLQPPGLGAGPAFPVAVRPMMFFSGDMKLLDAQSGELKLKVSSDQTGPVIYSPDGALLAVLINGQVRLWNSQTGKEEGKLKGFKGRPNATAFSPDGRVLAVASTTYDHQSWSNYIKIIGRSEVKLFDTRTWKEIRRVPDMGAVNTLAFTPSGRVLLIGGVWPENEKNIAGVKLLDLQTGNASNLPTGEDFTEAVDSLVVSRVGGLLAFRSGPETVKMLDAQTLTVKQTLDENSVGTSIERPTSRFVVSVKRVLAVAFSRDGKTLAAETDQGEIKLWDPRTGEVKKQLHDNQDDPTLVAVSADGMSFAEISGGKLLLWQAESDAKQSVALTDGPTANTVAVSADGKTVAVGRGREVLLLTTGGSQKTLNSQHGIVSSLAFSDDGRQLAGVAEDGTIGIWDVVNARLDKTLTDRGSISALRFAPHGQMLATAAHDNSITLWNLQTGLAQAKLQKHDGLVNALAFSPDGQWLASGGDDRTVILWEVGTGKSKRTLKGHDQTVTSLAFSPDGRLLASGSGNASVVLWEVRNGKLNRVLK